MSNMLEKMANHIREKVRTHASRENVTHIRAVWEIRQETDDPLILKILGIVEPEYWDPSEETPVNRAWDPDDGYIHKSARGSARVFMRWLFEQHDEIDARHRDKQEKAREKLLWARHGRWIPHAPAPVDEQAVKAKVTVKPLPHRLPMESLLLRHQRRRDELISPVYEDAPPTARANRERAQARVQRHIGSRIVHPEHVTKKRWSLS